MCLCLQQTDWKRWRAADGHGESTDILPDALVSLESGASGLEASTICRSDRTVGALGHKMAEALQNIGATQVFPSPGLLWISGYETMRFTIRSDLAPGF